MAKGDFETREQIQMRTGRAASKITRTPCAMDGCTETSRLPYCHKHIHEGTRLFVKQQIEEKRRGRK